MTKEELIAELQKIEGNPTIGIGLNKAWGKYCLAISGITPLYNHDGHKVEGVSVLEINAEDAFFIFKYMKISVFNTDEYKDYRFLVRLLNSIVFCGLVLPIFLYCTQLQPAAA